jgi:hypothetical protein
MAKGKKPTAGEVLPVDETNLIDAPKSVVDSGEITIPMPQSNVTPPPEFTEPQATVEIPVVIEPKMRERIEVDKEFLFRMLISLSRGMTSTFTGMSIPNRIIGGLFNIEDTGEKNRKYSEINQYVYDHQG